MGTLEKRLVDVTVNEFIQAMSKNLEYLLRPEPDRKELPELLTIKQAGELLNLSPYTIYGLVSKRKIPFFKPEGTKQLRFRRSELLAIIDSGRCKTMSEINEEVATVLSDTKKGRRKEC